MLQKQLQMKEKNKDGFPSILFRILRAILLGNLFIGKGVKAKTLGFEGNVTGHGVVTAGEGWIAPSQAQLEQRCKVQGTIKAGQDF